MNNNDHKQKVKKSFDLASDGYDCHSLRFFNESASHLNSASFALSAVNDNNLKKMPVNDEYLNYVLGQLKSAGSVTHKKMFGGVGLYLKGTFFALIAADVLYLKVDESNR